MKNLKERLYRFLRWTEKYTKTDMVYLTHGGFWLTAGQASTTIVNFFISVAFAYYLPKSAYGDYRYVLSVFAILSAFMLTGLSTSIIQSVAAGFEGSLKFGVKVGMKSSILSVIGALIGAGYYFYKGNSFLGISLLVIAGTTSVLNNWGLFASYVNGKKDFKRLSLYTFIDNVIPALLVLGTILVTHNVLILVFVYFVANTVMAFILYMRTLALYKPNQAQDPHLVSYSFRLSLLNVVNIITANIDKVVVYSSLGAVELAVYGFASAFPDQIRNVLKNLNSLMIPKFSESGLAAHKLELKRKTLQLLIVVGGIMAVYYILAPSLYHIFFPKYPESVYFSRILSLMILSALAMIPSAVFIAHRKNSELTKLSIIGSIFQLVVLFPAARMWGLIGVCVARVISSYINLGISYWMIRKDLR